MTTILKVRLNHKATHGIRNTLIPLTVKKNFTHNANLFHEVFTRVIMVCINKNKWVFQIKCTILVQSLNQVFVMVVDNVLTIFIVGTTQDSVSEWVTICFNFSAIVKEMLLVLRSIDTIKHDIQIP